VTRGGKRENEVIGSKGSIWISPRRTAGITLLLDGGDGWGFYFAFESILGASTLSQGRVDALLPDYWISEGEVVVTFAI